jgi:hypothetical protein
MKNIFFVVFLLCFTSLFGYQWVEIVPSDYDVNDVIFTPETLAATAQGILYHEVAGWQLYPTTLPVWQLMQISDTEVIAIMGDGSWSDGIYIFNLQTGEQQILEYAPWPEFIFYCNNDNKYYVGFGQGLLSSEDGENWNEVEYFSWNPCRAMIACEDNYVVGGDYVYYSTNSGTDWQQTEISWSFCAFAVNEEPEPTFYGVFPGTSYSSGLYSSENSGADWQVVFWHIYLTDVLRLYNGMTFVSFADEAEVEPGVASYDFEDDSFTFYNTGLPEATVNKLTINPLVNCLNVVACSSQGAYMLTGFVTETQEEQIPYSYRIKTYPNPFNPSLTIGFELLQEANVIVGIYNLKGQLVKKIENDFLKKGKYNFSWNGKNESLQDCASGVYFCRITSSKFHISRKIVLLR